jgi:hypothetical protein
MNALSLIVENANFLLISEIKVLEYTRLKLNDNIRENI